MLGQEPGRQREIDSIGDLIDALRRRYFGDTTIVI